LGMPRTCPIVFDQQCKRLEKQRMTPTPGIVFCIDPQTSREIRAWIEELDWQYIKHRIEDVGGCTVAKINLEPGEWPTKHLETIPEKPGIYRALMSVVGGEVIYRFCPQGKTVTLHIDTLYSIPNIADHPGRTMTLNQPLAHQVDADGKDILFVYAVLKYGENLFGFTGEIFDIFRAWERYSENAEEFEFKFQPISIGCDIWVIHRESQESLCLTENVEW
jgi:hypothetical protein